MWPFKTRQKKIKDAETLREMNKIIEDFNNEDKMFTEITTTIMNFVDDQRLAGSPEDGETLIMIAKVWLMTETATGAHQNVLALLEEERLVKFLQPKPSPLIERVVNYRLSKLLAPNGIITRAVQDVMQNIKK
jgi:hypothetical protein